MPTLYVENVPEELYEALRARAQGNRKSIAAEVLSLLEENVPTPSELARRKKLIRRVDAIRSIAPEATGPFRSTEEMQREGRGR
jgi:plasmid stability protein